MSWQNAKSGKVYLVGAGPGDTELITIRGIECLKEADTVVIDHLVNPDLLEYVKQEAEVIFAGKFPDRHILSQDKINELLVKKAREGKIVVRLKGGDPFLFGRGAEEALFLAKHKLIFEVVPGVSSALAVPAYAGIPLTHRGVTSSVGIFTGHEDPTKKNSTIAWDKIATGCGTLVFLMGVENLEKIVRNLIRFGRKPQTACSLIMAGCMLKQKTITGTLATIIDRAKKASIRPPAILIVGDVVSLRKHLNWYETKPLFGKKILITRASNDTGRLAKLLKEQGGVPLEFPVIKIEPLKDYRALDSAIQEIDNFQWLIFTSQNGVRFFKERLEFLKKDIRILKGVKIAGIGPKTKLALENIGIKVDVQPEEYSQEGLLKKIKNQKSKIKIEGQNILIVRAKEARDVLPEGLRRMGGCVKIVPAYRTVTRSPACPERSRGGHQVTSKNIKDVDVITFTSSSCVRNFVKIVPKNILNDILNKAKVATIGPVTSAEAKSSGLKVDIEAKKFTIEGLVKAIVTHYRDANYNS